MLGAMNFYLCDRDIGISQQSQTDLTVARRVREALRLRFNDTIDIIGRELVQSAGLQAFCKPRQVNWAWAQRH